MSLYIFSLLFLQIQLSVSNFLQVESNYRNQKLEKNNVVNKGVWVRNVKDSDKATSSFLFRGNSVDVDNIVQGDFNAFADGSAPNSPYISKYVERNKRSPTHKRIRRYRKGENVGNNQNHHINDIDNSASVKSKVISKLKPSTVFNDYPYEIAILLGNNKKSLVEAQNYSTYVINEITKNETKNTTILPLNEAITNFSNKIDALVDDNNNDNITSVPKRSMNNLENEILKKSDNIEDLNNTHDLSHLGRDISVKDDKNWHQNAPIPDTNRFNLLKKTDDKIVRPVTERGLIKVLSMLTNTFKKIMRQHSDIKDINKKLNNMNEDFMKNIEIVSDKFQDFEAKYATLVGFNQKILELEEKLVNKEQHFKTKERQLSKNLIEFEIQQKKFLTQQRQFYNIQKLMLAQNERINTKQNAIAKTQSEISHRQNNFARILKKAKQIFIDNKLSQPKATAQYPRLENKTGYYIENTETGINPLETRMTTSKPQNIESVKINLFSVPTVDRLQNQDQLLLKEKDAQPVDDLVYKYYFNNTFIDNMMRNFLSGFISVGDHNDKTRNIKNKRDEITERTTLLLPVNQTGAVPNGKSVVRERRWISHHSRRKWRHKNKGKAGTENNNVDDEKVAKDSKKAINNLLDAQLTKILPNEGKNQNLHKNDPFVSMAINFCKGIGQNSTSQILNWCVEKALRRLENIDVKMPPPPPPPVMVEKIIFQPLSPPTTEPATKVTVPIISTKKPSTTHSLPPTENIMTVTPIMYTLPHTFFTETTKNFNMFFPDNDELETNLKNYELKPDPEGNVYYDGSLHASDIIKDENNGDSDVLPEIDSVSRIADTMDTDTFDTQRLRRDFLSRTLFSRMKYESMLKKMTKL